MPPPFPPISKRDEHYSFCRLDLALFSSCKGEAKQQVAWLIILTPEGSQLIWMVIVRVCFNFFPRWDSQPVEASRPLWLWRTSPGVAASLRGDPSVNGALPPRNLEPTLPTESSEPCKHGILNSLSLVGLQCKASAVTAMLLNGGKQWTYFSPSFGCSLHPREGCQGI